MTGDAAPAARARDVVLPLRILVATAFLLVILVTIAQVFFRFTLDAPLA